MKQQKSINDPEYSVKDVIPDYINFILVLIFGSIFNWQGSDITAAIVTQIFLLVIFFSLFVVFKTLYEAIKECEEFRHIASWMIVICLVEMFIITISVSFISFSNFIAGTNMWSTIIYFPFVLYAHRGIFQKKWHHSKKNSLTHMKIFTIASCLPLLLFGPILLKNLGLSDKISFFICYFILCFPYKKTFNLLSSPAFKKKIAVFLSDEENLAGMYTIGFGLIFFLLLCYAHWVNGEDAHLHLWIPLLFIGVGTFICCKK